jgi:microcystin-dependent protein
VLTWIDAVYDQIEREGGTPVRAFRGVYIVGDSYSKGDMVTFNKALWVARKATSVNYFDDEVWRRIMGHGGGGGVGGSSAGGAWPSPVLSTLNMNSYSITGLKPPASPLDAATKDYVDKNGGNISKAVADTAQFLALAGLTDGDKLDSMFVGGRSPVRGDLAFVGYDKTAANNAKGGIYRFSGNWTRIVDLSNGVPQTLDDLLDVVAVSPSANQIIAYNAVSKKWEAQDNNAAAVIKHFAATAVSAAGTAGQTAEQILLAQYATLAGSAPRAGVFAVIENGAGNDGRLNGVYYFDGTNWTKFARELSASGAGGLVKALVADADPNLITNPQPLGTAQYTVENNAKEIKVVDGAGNWNTIYSETNIRNLIAQSRSFKGTVVEKGATVVGTSPLDVLPATAALTATDVGTYYVFVGTGGHVILASEIGNSVSNVDGTVLSPGDWIQVANLGTTATPKYDYVVIHGDALSMARARAVFGLNLWADGAFERGSIVRYQPTPNAGIHYYVASGDVLTGDTAPGAVPPPGTSATPIAVTVTAVTGGKDYTMTVTGGPASGGGVLNVTFDVDATPGADIQTATITAGMTADQVADAIVAGWSNPQTTATKGTSPAEINVKVKNAADSITTFTINAASLVAINATAGVNKWVDITPYAALSSLPDCYELLKATDGQVPSWSVANRRWEPTTPNQPLVYMGTGVWDASKIASRPDNLGFPADTLPAPTVYGPQAGDLYINLSSGKVTSFTGPAPSSRSTATFTGGAESPTLDVTQSSIAKLTDVDVATAAPKDGEVLTYDLATTKWQPKKVATSLGDLTDVTEAPASTIGNILVADGTGLWTEQANPSYTKVEIDTKISGILTGLVHDISVKDILNSPPAAPVEGDAYIIGTAPLLGWLGHANEVAYFDSGAWIFTPAQANEAHLVEALQSIWAWGPPPGGVGASRWVKIANTGAAAGATAKHGVGEIIPWIADTFPDDYLECRGQIVAITAYNDLYTVIGNKYNATTGADGVSTFALPDLRGYFLRGVGANGGEGAPGVVQSDTTRLPRSNFTGTAAAAGDHIHGLRTGRYANFGTGGGARAVNNLDGRDYEVFTGDTLSAGNHTHNVTITGGGDIETRPKSFSVRWLIRYKAIDGGAMGPRGQNGVGVPAITAGDEKKVMTVTAGTAVWAAPAPALPNGTAVGQKLEWNGTIWVPTVDKVTITQGSDYLVDANPAMYEIKGSIWCNSNQWVHLRIYGADGTTLLVPDANWFVSGSAWMQVSAYASLTDSSTDSDTHGGKGYNLLPSGIVEIGKNWVNHLKGWVDIDANMICNARNGRSDNAPITLRYSYHNDQDHQVTGVLRISAPRSVVIGRVQVTSGATETFYNCVVRKTLL